MRSLASDNDAAESAAEWLVQAVSTSVEAILGADLDGNIVAWNDGAEAFYGYTADEMVGRPAANVKAPSEGRDLSDLFARLARGENIPPYESRHIRKDGTEVDVSISASPVRDAHGTVIGSCAIVRDITDWKRIRTTLESAIAHEHERVEKLQELDRFRTTFVSSVSHELRTPLTSIIGYLELLNDEMYGMNEEQRELVQIVQRNSDRLLALIEDMLVLSSIESGSFRSLKEPVDIHNLVAAAHREATGDNPERVRIDIDSGVGAVLGDARQLSKLLENLLSNAIKFTPADGPIVISAQRSSDGLVLRVRDSGVGMTAHEVEEAFNPFFRSASAVQRAIPGTGLGLSIAKTIVEQHGGRIECTSEQGVGTTMTVVLPYAIAAQRAS